MVAARRGRVSGRAGLARGGGLVGDAAVGHVAFGEVDDVGVDHRTVPPDGVGAGWRRGYRELARVDSAWANCWTMAAALAGFFRTHIAPMAMAGQVRTVFTVVLLG